MSTDTPGLLRGLFNALRESAINVSFSDPEAFVSKYAPPLPLFDKAEYEKCLLGKSADSVQPYDGHPYKSISE